MSTVFTHAVTALALGKAYSSQPMPPRFWALSILCACIPDTDVIGLALGIPYGDLFGHRGFSHSLTFAFLLALLAVWDSQKNKPKNTFTFGHGHTSLFLYFFILTASHGILDGMTNGGLGIAYFSPFDDGRYFLPWRPLEVPPIGARGFFTDRGLEVMLNEMLWVWLPCLALISLSAAAKKAQSR